MLRPMVTWEWDSAISMPWVRKINSCNPILNNMDKAGPVLKILIRELRSGTNNFNEVVLVSEREKVR